MRELKFRAWSYDKKIMLKSEWWVDIDEGMEDFSRIKRISYIGEKGEEIISKPLEIMQYTGLKDKNGVEIYEGDIVLYENYYEKTTAVVTFGTENVGIHGCSYYIEAGFYNKHEYYPEPTSSRDEVIGNIYENPELLQDNKLA